MVVHINMQLIKWLGFLIVFLLLLFGRVVGTLLRFFLRLALFFLELLPGISIMVRLVLVVVGWALYTSSLLRLSNGRRAWGLGCAIILCVVSFLFSSCQFVGMLTLEQRTWKDVYTVTLPVLGSAIAFLKYITDASKDCGESLLSPSVADKCLGAVYDALSV